MSGEALLAVALCVVLAWGFQRALVLWVNRRMPPPPRVSRGRYHIKLRKRCGLCPATVEPYFWNNSGGLCVDCFADDAMPLTGIVPNSDGRTLSREQYPVLFEQVRMPVGMQHFRLPPPPTASGS
jgi:hypothetical protein